MNEEVDLPLDSHSTVDLARQAKRWAWYVRAHLCLNILWALANMNVFAGIPALAGRLLEHFLEGSSLAILVGPMVSAVLISRAARHGGSFTKLAIADTLLSVSAFWIILPAVQ